MRESHSRTLLHTVYTMGMTPTPSLSSNKDALTECRATLTKATAERDALRADVDAMLTHDVSEWLEMQRGLRVGFADYESTVSWRVTKPLRLIRTFQYAAKEHGLSSALRLAGAVLTRRRGAR